MNKPLWLRILRRASKYSLVGCSTYLLDLGLIWTLVKFGLSPLVSVGVGFMIAVGINYLLSYYWVYKGTERKLSHGYAFFLIIALVAAVIISYSTVYLADTFSISLYTARTIVAAFVGIFVFIVNTKYNFKLL